MGNHGEWRCFESSRTQSQTIVGLVAVALSEVAGFEERWGATWKARKHAGPGRKSWGWPGNHVSSVRRQKWTLVPFRSVHPWVLWARKRWAELGLAAPLRLLAEEGWRLPRPHESSRSSLASRSRTTGHAGEPKDRWSRDGKPWENWFELIKKTFKQ